ncbi:MAG: hypothetical protein R3B41_03745 [Candidatus Doudnabacteria bacterium]
MGSEVASGLKLGERVESLGTVVENSPGKINGFNHNGTFHGHNQVISRGVSPQELLDTEKRPLVTFEGRYGRTGYLTRDAFVSLDRTGEVVSSWTAKEFGSTIKNVLSRIK